MLTLKEVKKETKKKVKKKIPEVLIYEKVKVAPISWIEAFEGKFALYGDEETLKNLYYKGVGLRTAEGFGMLSQFH